MDYNFSADLLNKFSQLTPWVQAVTVISCAAVPLGVMYFMKEMVCRHSVSRNAVAQNPGHRDRSCALASGEPQDDA